MRRARRGGIVSTVGPLSRLCALCGERLGVYEPIVAFGADGRRRTSIAREPGLAAADVALMHEECARGAGEGAPGADERR